MFTGFSPEAIDFLWGIRFNNNREWFQNHKQQYQTALYEPMKALCQDLSDALPQEDGVKMHLSRITATCVCTRRFPIRKAFGCAGGATAAVGWSIPACFSS